MLVCRTSFASCLVVLSRALLCNTCWACMCSRAVRAPRAAPPCTNKLEVVRSLRRVAIGLRLCRELRQPPNGHTIVAKQADFNQEIVSTLYACIRNYVAAINACRYVSTADLSAAAAHAQEPVDATRSGGRGHAPAELTRTSAYTWRLRRCASVLSDTNE